MFQKSFGLRGLGRCYAGVAIAPLPDLRYGRGFLTLIFEHPPQGLDNAPHRQGILKGESAGVVELVDTLDSGSSGLTPVGVRVPPPAPSHGGVAQLVRATGSYPVGRRFESARRYQFGCLPAVMPPYPQPVVMALFRENHHDPPDSVIGTHDLRTMGMPRAMVGEHAGAWACA